MWSGSYTTSTTNMYHKDVRHHDRGCWSVEGRDQCGHVETGGDGQYKMNGLKQPKPPAHHAMVFDASFKGNAKQLVVEEKRRRVKEESEVSSTVTTYVHNETTPTMRLLPQ